MTPAHDQTETHRYVIYYPDHAPRERDPHYVDFKAYRRRTRNTARCAFAARIGDDSECGGSLELHHAHIEFALANAVDLELLERDYPGVSDAGLVGEWIESAANLEWLCTAHHRGHGGVHVASAADYEAEHYIRGLIE